MNVRTKGFCSALLRCGEIKLITPEQTARGELTSEYSYIASIWSIGSIGLGLGFGLGLPVGVRVRPRPRVRVRVRVAGRG